MLILPLIRWPCFLHQEGSVLVPVLVACAIPVYNARRSLSLRREYEGVPVRHADAVRGSRFLTKNGGLQDAAKPTPLASGPRESRRQRAASPARPGARQSPSQQASRGVASSIHTPAYTVAGWANVRSAWPSFFFFRLLNGL